MLRLTSGLLFLFGVVNGDTYMQNPRGSNNRLNEKSANRANGNRLFDSQNNNRGGYNVGETGQAGQAFANTANGGFAEGTTTQMYDASNTQPNTGSVQYNMAYQEGSMMRMTWTSQHGCGNAMNNCNMVIQFGCDNTDYDSGENAAAFAAFPDKALGIRMTLRDGGNTQTPNEPGANVGQASGTFVGNNGNAARGRHESEEYYAMCRLRERQKGLFTADQKLKGHSQIYTRQNPNGQRRGLECPEERDYFPWDYPSPWRDIAWVGADVDYCKTNIAPESMNVKAKWVCVGNNGANGPDNDDIPTNDQAAANTEAECTAASGIWTSKSWGQTNNAAWADQFCQRALWQQVNHLGNTDGSALGGQMAYHEWRIPSFAELTDPNGYGCYEYTGDDGEKYVRMVTRNRYNISTGDYDPYQTFADQNNDPKNGVISPVTQNPTVDIGAYMQGLRLAINTAQTGRTFQDRSHVFNVFKAPPNVGKQTTNTILNVNVRGKRGNIVQTFPAMEYDFEPNDFVVQKNQCMHFQWTGSNTHNNGNPAGDGQAGDAGEGAGGTDRSNVMEMNGLRGSFPIAYDVEGASSFFDQVTCKYPLKDFATLDTGFEDNEWMSSAQAKAIFATAGYYYKNGDQLNAINGDDVNPLLNNVPASFRQGLICCTDASSTPGEYFFLSTRNNNFTNRSQKLKITIAATTGAQFEYYKAS